MSEQEVQDSQKTVVAFIAGLLIGGLLVWIFAAEPKDHDSDLKMDTEENDVAAEVGEDIEVTLEETTPADVVPELVTGDGTADVANQEAGMTVSLDGATYPTDEGWIGVRTYTNGQMTNILGVVRYSKEVGLVPETIQLQTPTVSGRTYAIVFFQENGDGGFDPRSDVQIETDLSTFEVN